MPSKKVKAGTGSPPSSTRSRSPPGASRSRSPPGATRSRSPPGAARSRSPPDATRSRSPPGAARSRMFRYNNSFANYTVDIPYRYKDKVIKYKKFILQYPNGDYIYQKDVTRLFTQSKNVATTWFASIDLYEDIHAFEHNISENTQEPIIYQLVKLDKYRRFLTINTNNLYISNFIYDIDKGYFYPYDRWEKIKYDIPLKIIPV